MNYVSSHDDSNPFDKKREKPMESATKLLLAPGISQVYYGDESARSLDIPGTEGDATLRSFMNWDAIQNNLLTKEVLAHWSRLGKFRANHLAVGNGVHQLISSSPYVFSRVHTWNYTYDQVVVGLDLTKGNKSISVGNIFANGEKVRDAYSGRTAVVKNGMVTIDPDFEILLLEQQ